MVRQNVRLPKEEIAAFCRRHHIRRLSLFGSVLTDRFGRESDVDVLVAFAPGHSLGWDILDLEHELARILGVRRVDLVNEKYLNSRLRDPILTSAQVQYAEG